MKPTSRWAALLAAPMLMTLCGCALGERFSSADGGHKFQSPLTFARIYEKEGDFAKARQLYLAAAKQPATRPAAMHRLALLAARTGDRQQAELYFARAQRLSPDDAGLLNDWGYYFLQQGRLVEAEQKLREALRIDPKHTRALNNLALALGQQGRMQESLAAFRQVLSEAEARANVAYLCMQRGDYEAAASWYEQALALDPTLAPAVDGLAQLRDYRPPAEPATTIQTASASMPYAPPAVLPSAPSAAPPRPTPAPAPLPPAPEPTEDVGIATIGYAPHAQPPQDDAEPSQHQAHVPERAEQPPDTQPHQGWKPPTTPDTTQSGWHARRQH